MRFLRIDVVISDNEVKGSRRLRRALPAVAALALVVLLPASVQAMAGTADEIHYTFTGPTSVSFDWRGTATDIRFGPTTTYGSTVTSHAPTPLPFSSPGPFQEADLTGLAAGITYHYSIGGGPDATFTTAPTGTYRFDAVGDIGDSVNFPNVGTTMNEIAADNPAFVLMIGDLTYSEPDGQAAVDQHFNDVMVWSGNAAYMPAWGNHEWEDSSQDDLRNYKGRLQLPNPQSALGSPAPGCCGSDWSWFDAGGVRFISYPEPYSGSATWSDWQTKVDPIMTAAQADPAVHFIVTFGHRPAYSTGFHPGDASLATILDSLGAKYSKYVLNLNGHSHDYERFMPINGVTHITVGGGGSALEPPWTSSDPRTAFRAMHLAHLRIDVSSTGMRIDAICGPPTSKDDTSCIDGSVLDSYTIGVAPPPPPPPTTLYVDQGNVACTDGGSGTQTQPYCTIGAAAAHALAGTTVIVASGTYNERINPGSGAAGAPVVYTTVPGATVTVTGGQYGFYLSGRSWVTVKGFNVTGTVKQGIYVGSSSNVVLEGNRVSYSGQPLQGQTQSGIYLTNTTSSLVWDNTVDHNTDAGIQLTGGSTGDEVRGNVTLSNAQQWQRQAAGIRIYNSPGNVVDRNISHDNEDSGIESFNGANNTLIYENVIYGNGDHGIDDNACTGQEIVGNTVYKNVTAGINLENGSTGATVANNTSVDNGIASPRTHSDIRVESGSTAGTTLDYDLVYLTAKDTLFIWNSVNYTTLSAFKTASGQELHGIAADPKWKNAGGADFHLVPGSPAIDSGNALVPNEPGTDVEGSPRVDDPATPNTGVGPRTYDDRGAYEYQPGDAPPVAALSVTPPSGAAPLAVVADASASTDTDATPILNYRFDFGDGTVAGPQSASTAPHMYTHIGTYTVTVTVTDTAGLSSTKSTGVTVNDAPPSASLTVSPASGQPPLQVTADASASTDADGTPISTYAFSFGDGSTSSTPSSPTATHTYTASGTYTVTVTVTDTAGLSAQTSRQVTLTGGTDGPPSASLSVTPSSGAAPLQVTADASASSDPDAWPIATYSFSFGDGTSSGPQTVATATHTYAASGSYNLTVTVTDTAGLSSQASVPVTISSNLVGNPGFETNTSGWGTSGSSAGVALTRVSGGHSGSWAARLANTTTKKAATCLLDDNPNWVTKTAATTYTGSLWVRADSPGATLTLRFREYNGTKVAGTTTSTAKLTTAWQQVSVAYTVKKAGTALDLNAYVSNVGAGTCFYADDTSISTPTVIDLPPSAALKVTPASGNPPLQVTADASASTDTDATSIATYVFDFGDGTTVGPQKAATAAHIYNAAGAYTIKVTVTDTGGLSSQASAQVTVQKAADAPPAASLAVSPPSGAPPLQVTADASASTDTDATPIATYTFDFGDNTVVGPQTAATAKHTYAGTGVYTVKVTVTDTGGQSSQANAQVSVQVAVDDPPAAMLSVTPNSGNPPLQISADASASTDTDATPIASYTFDFGDGTGAGPQAGAAATHTYGTAGTYTVQVTVTDTGGQSAQTTAQVSVQPSSNLVGNPGFETDTSGWNTSGSGSGITLTQATGGYSGSYAAVLTNTSNGNSGCTLNDSPNWVATTKAGTYTASLWVRGDKAGAPLSLRFREYSGSTLLGTTTATVTISTSWQQLSVAYTIPSGGTTLDLNAYIPTANSAPGVCFYADDASITLGP
jgi:PKD repeat protein